METRSEKYREYRKSLLNEDTQKAKSDSPNISQSSNYQNKGTLPMSEVIIEENKNEDAFITMQKRIKKQYLILTISIVGGVTLFFILLMLGLFLWR